MAKKNKKKLIRLKCSVCGHINYVTSKPLDNSNTKFQVKKHCPWCKKHTLHIETKIK